MYRPKINFQHLYADFNENILDFDCGQKCSKYNMTGKPFCCDICEAIPTAYDQEWHYLQKHTDLWHVWSQSDCNPDQPNLLHNETDLVDYQVLIACKGPAACIRNYRAISCRQFPFFPYITQDFRFLGMAYEWHFETKCWVINHLHLVKNEYRKQFITFYDQLFSMWPDDFQSYASLSDQMRAAFIERKKRIPILHRNGQSYLLSPKNEKLEKVDPNQFQKYGIYKRKIS